MGWNPTGSTGGGGGGSGTVTSVAAGDTSIVVGGVPTVTPTIETGTLDVIATDHPPAANWSNNSKKITNLADGSGAQDAAAFHQIPTALPPNGSAGGDLSGTFPNPTVAKINGSALGSLASPVTNGALIWNGSAWVPAASAYQPGPLTGDVTTSGAAATLVGTANVESIIRANTLNQMGAPTAAVNMNSQNFTNLLAAIVAAQAPTVGQLAGTQIAYVVSGCTWTPDSAGATLAATMAAGTVSIKGILLTVAAVTSRSFTASVDTYVDFTDNGDGTAAVTYTAVANNGPSPALAGSSAATTLRNAIITSASTNIAAQSSINQGDPAAMTPPTAIASTTVAVGSNGNSIATSTLSVAANSFPAAGIAQVDTSNGTGAFFGALIAYTGGGGTTTLTGVTVLCERTGTGTVATGGVVASWARYNVTDSLGNLINPTAPYPTSIGYKSKLNSQTFTTAGTTEHPITDLFCQFVVPPGPSRRVRIWANLFVATSATAGTLVVGTTAYGSATGNSFTDVGYGVTSDSVASDGSSVNPVGEVFLAPGAYVALARVTQGAAGNLTIGSTGSTVDMGVDLVG